MSQLLDDKDFREKVAKDVKIEKSNLELELLTHSDMMQKYITLLTRYSRQLAQAQNKLDEKYKEKYEHYRFEYDKVLDNAREVGVYIKGDADYIKEKEKVDDLTSNVNFLQRTIDNLNQKSWSMKNLIELNRFLKGERD